MKTHWKITILTMAVAIPAFMFAAGSPQGESMWRAVWPWDMEMANEPSASQVPFLMVVSAAEGIGLGLAISFLVWGRPTVARMAGGANTTLVMVAVAWMMGNWWMHDSLHMVNGENFTGLIVLEYVFHLTLIAAGAYVALALARGWKGGAPTETAAAAPRAAATR